MTLTLAPDGTLTAWDEGGHPVLHPLHDAPGGAPRGGAPVCVPIFSALPPDMRRAGCDLPLHGLAARMERDTDAGTSGPLTARLRHRADRVFEWDFDAEIAVTPSGAGLEHRLEVRRAPNCATRAGMPLSLGWHPYFATDGRDFTVGIDGWRLDRAAIGPGASLIFFSDSEGPPGPVTLRTAHGRLSMTFPADTAYDRVCVWTDAPDRYLCIEPIMGYLRFGHPGWLLEPGESRRATCHLRLDRP